MMTIEQRVLDYLSESLDIPCVMEKPYDLPDEFIILEKTGGGERNYIRSATFAVKSYARTMLRAAEINESVKDAMRGITELTDISGCSLNSDYNYTDTAMMRYRYQAVFDIDYCAGGTRNV